jgi:hypothetical protein
LLLLLTLALGKQFALPGFLGFASLARQSFLDGLPARCG